MTYQYKNFQECLELCNDFNYCRGIYPIGERRKWEDRAFKEQSEESC